MQTGVTRSENGSLDHLFCPRGTRVAILLYRRRLDLPKDRNMKKERTLKQVLMMGLGKSWMMWGPRNEVKHRCKVPGKSGWYKCEECYEERERIEIDHINPVVQPKDGFTTWDQYILSKFVEADKLQALCHECHKAKTKKENAVRRETKKCARDAKKKG